MLPIDNLEERKMALKQNLVTHLEANRSASRCQERDSDYRKLFGGYMKQREE